MEFLPSDIAPLHNPGLSECVPEICLDPRRAAEEACTAALGQVAARSPLRRLWKDIELSLNDPDRFGMPNIIHRTEELYDPGKVDDMYIKSGMLRATAALFAYRAHGNIPESAMHEAYMSIASLAATCTPRALKKGTFRGHMAELAVNGILLRDMRNIPFPSSPREEASQNSLLNNDLGAFDGRAGHGGKVPVQVKYKGRSTLATYKRQRVLPVFAEPLFLHTLRPFPDLVKTDGNIVRTVFGLIAQEADEKHSKGSTAAKALRALSRELSERIDAARREFNDAAYAQGLKKLVDDAVTDSSRNAAAAKLHASEYVLINGQYIFFNHLRAERVKKYNTIEHRLLFEYGRLVGSIACQTTTKDGSTTLTQQVADGQPADLPQKLLHQLVASNNPPAWQPIQ